MNRIRITLFLSAIMMVSAAYAQTYEECVEQAYNAAQQDSLEKAVELYRQALRLSPGDHRNALVFHNLGHVQEMIYWKNPDNTKMADEALYNYSHAIELQPLSLLMRESRARFYLNLKNYDKAIGDYTHILKKEPDNAEARNYRAFAYYQQRDYENARRDYETVLKRHPADYTSALGVALVLQKTHKVGEAVRRMEFLIVEHPDKAELYAVRASMYGDLDNLSLALVDLNQAIKLEPNRPDYYLQRALVYERMGKKNQAESDRRRAANL